MSSPRGSESSAGQQLLAEDSDDEPICHRTRMHLPMDNVDLDDLDKLLVDEGDELFDEEGEQYQEFLRVRLLSLAACSFSEQH